MYLSLIHIYLDGLTNTTWVPGVTKATTGRAATEDQLQQVSDAVGAGWKVNTGTVAGSSGVSNGAASTKVSSGEEVKPVSYTHLNNI